MQSTVADATVLTQPDSYFAHYYDAVRYPIDSPGHAGLRLPQLGAAHAIASHFTLRHEPALLAMPTGTGKSAVLFLTAFLLRARRVLVVTPSKLLRGQVADEFRSLAVLKRAGVLATDIPGPEVCEVTHRIREHAIWQTLETADVVVGTPNSVSPAIAGVVPPPPELFDLILVDEAHHSPARTWNELLEAFPTARRVLVTATPFRRDRREIKARLIYDFPVSRAFQSDIFARIVYEPVRPQQGENHDSAIARAAERALLRDRAAGFDHALLVRTDLRRRADELAKVYKDETRLRLEVIHSDVSYRTIGRIIKRLRAGEIDGIITVNMLGEGFDYPNFKVAAIHAPHRSLAITLQFVGRFARTGASQIGDATFLTVPNIIELEAKRLYDEDSIWEKLIPKLLERRVESEVRIREAISTFAMQHSTNETEHGFSLYSLRPKHHVKVFKVTGDVDLSSVLELPKPYLILHQEISDEEDTMVLVTSANLPARWSTNRAFDNREFDLFVLVHDREHQLLFVSASVKKAVLYDALVESVTGLPPVRVPFADVRKALLDLQRVEAYNVGMRNRTPGSHAETYRILAGANAHKVVQQSDGRHYQQGHVLVKAYDEDEELTIGVSGSATVWSLESSGLTQLIDWCRKLGAKLVRDEVVVTGSELDYLSVGTVVTAIPGPIIAVSWPESAYRRSVEVTYRDATGRERGGQLLDLDIRIVPDSQDTTYVDLEVSSGSQNWYLRYDLAAPRLITPIRDEVPEMHVLVGRDHISLSSYLNDNPLLFFLENFAFLRERECQQSSVGVLPFDREQIRTLTWEGVNIEQEYGTPDSIHNCIESLLLGDCYDYLVYDHSPGEVADFVGIACIDDEMRIDFVHCKGSSEKKPGDRVGDVYEVAGQVIKGVMWAHNHQRLIDRIESRRRDGIGKVLIGAERWNELKRLMPRVRTSYRMLLVQPGISKSGLSDKIAHVLASADEHGRRARMENLSVIASP